MVSAENGAGVEQMTNMTYVCCNSLETNCEIVLRKSEIQCLLGRCNKEIEALKETNTKTEEESNETELVIETSARQAGFSLLLTFS